MSTNEQPEDQDQALGAIAELMLKHAVNDESMRILKALLDAQAALEFYADPKTYAGVKFATGSHGPIIDDFCARLGLLGGQSPGKRARETLKSTAEVVLKFLGDRRANMGKAAAPQEGAPSGEKELLEVYLLAYKEGVRDAHKSLAAAFKEAGELKAANIAETIARMW